MKNQKDNDEHDVKTKDKRSCLLYEVKEKLKEPK